MGVGEQQREIRRAACVLLASLLVSTLSPPAQAWEGRTQQLVVSRAVESLPYPLRAYYESNRSSIAQLAADPSQWGEEGSRPEQRYIQLDSYGTYPFAELPRDYNVAVRRFTRAKVTRRGTLPWAVGSYSLKLEEAFRDKRWDEVKRYSAILAYYVAESHDPFNTTINHDGALSSQPGVDKRYSRSLVERYQAFFIIRPGGAYKIEDPTNHAFGMVVEANTWVDNILYADNQARHGKPDYNDDYYDAFYDSVGAILVRQLTTASQNVGAYWYTAWVNAGSPPPPAR
ncbi:MAG TPA: hypothetical protein VNN18_04820 [Candidatus Xenobia bacterium]|nr:hypothetical protein [Candidatus Xenobia bacterium]